MHTAVQDKSVLLLKEREKGNGILKKHARHYGCEKNFYT